MMKKIIIVGAGVSGVYLSILLKQNLMDNIEVIVLEQNATSLKKLLATGNGRCNLSNRDMNIQYYQSDNQDIVNNIISSFDMKSMIEQLGLYCIYQGQLLYPKSEQAQSVKNILMDIAKDLGVIFIYNQSVTSIEKGEQYIVHANESYKADYVVFAMGSEAGKLSGSDNRRYDLLKMLKLSVIKPTPSLVQMKTQPVLNQLKGVRVKGTFSLLEDDVCIHKEKGELLFTDYGISGIAVMQLSSLCKDNHEYQVAIDFFDNEDEKKMREYIELRLNKDYNHFYDGLFHSKISSFFESFEDQDVESILKRLKDFRLSITSLQTYETAQVMKGGLSMKEVDSSLQISKYPGMYAMGEILNVAGMCGGYNLHFAFSSAYRVAQAINKDMLVEV